MIVHRFMSAAEFRKLMGGEVLLNASTHDGFKTSSVGFCFFTESPSEAIHWLCGLVDSDYCVTMAIRKGLLKKSSGTYSDPKRRNLDKVGVEKSPTMEKTEWCCSRYSIKDVKILHVTQEFAVYSEIRDAMIRLGVVKRK